MTRTVWCPEIAKKSDEKKQTEVFGATHKAMDELAGGLEKKWTTCTTLRR